MGNLNNPGSPGSEVILKTSDETVNNSDVRQDDDELLLPLLANEVWEFRCLIRVLGGVASDFSKNWTIPAGAVMKCLQDAAIGGLGVWGTLSAPTNQGAENWVVSAAAERWILMWGIVINGATAGDMQLQWAQDTAVAEDTKVLANSYIIATRLA